jgi:hypothetical protein
MLQLQGAEVGTAAQHGSFDESATPRCQVETKPRLAVACIMEISVVVVVVVAIAVGVRSPMRNADGPTPVELIAVRSNVVRVARAFGKPTRDRA